MLLMTMLAVLVQAPAQMPADYAAFMKAVERSGKRR